MPSNKNININYTSREFDSIKEDLINYAKKYYPNKFKDFNEGDIIEVYEIKEIKRSLK